MNRNYTIPPVAKCRQPDHVWKDIPSPLWHGWQRCERCGANRYTFPEGGRPGVTPAVQAMYGEYGDGKKRL
jgi:hypothetical protein